MKQTIVGLALLALVAGCTEPEPARDRDPAEALQADRTQPGFLVDAPSYQVREAIRSSALEVRQDRALFLAAAMDAERAAQEEALRPGEQVAEHPAFPFNALVRLTHRDTGASVQVRIVDEGPFDETLAPLEPDPVIAISPAAARQLGAGPGDRAHVWVEVVEWLPR
jgi:rare lipoprotein A (peptidoglycan hydrolase)